METILFGLTCVAGGYIIGICHVAIRLSQVMKDLGMDDDIPSKDDERE